MCCHMRNDPWSSAISKYFENEELMSADLTTIFSIRNYMLSHLFHNTGAYASWVQSSDAAWWEFTPPPDASSDPPSSLLFLFQPDLSWYCKWNWHSSLGRHSHPYPMEKQGPISTPAFTMFLLSPAGSHAKSLSISAEHMSIATSKLSCSPYKVMK